jgi:hypothetical protein
MTAWNAGLSGLISRVVASLHASLICVPESLLGALVGVLAAFGKGAA